MNKKIVLILAAVLMITALPAQNEMYLNLKKVFVSGTITDKTEVIEKAAEYPGAERLIADGLSFADTNASLFDNEQPMISLAAKAVQNADKCDGAETYNLVMNIFQKFSDSSVRQAAFNYLLKTKRTSDKTASIIENYAVTLLNERNDDEGHLLSCIAVLDKIHSNTSFRVLFDYASSPYLSDEVKSAALAAMNRLTDVYRISMLSIITDSPVPNKLSALQMILENEMNSDILRAEAAESALSTSIIHAGDTFDSSLIDLQMMALAELRRLSWTKSASLAADFFSVARSEFEAGNLLPGQFIEVIESVKELSVVKAGTLFTDYLNYINANVENGLSCSVPVVLAVISSLGSLGDKVAFDALLYVSYVSYPDEVILASREALARLKW
ncbi:MAG: hypothetical protein KBT02_07705 [Treponema sp.]|nr:hypothetical protein [Candidatus Treponema caballi]